MWPVVVMLLEMFAAQARCPSAVAGARTEIADLDGGVRIAIAADDEAARRAIRERAADRAFEQEEGWIDPDDWPAACPGLLPRTRLVATDTAAGAVLVLRPFDPSHVGVLRALVRRQAQPFQAATNRISRASKEARTMF
jgi:hypothetical protein